MADGLDTITPEAGGKAGFDKALAELDRTVDRAVDFKNRTQHIAVSLDTLDLCARLLGTLATEEIDEPTAAAAVLVDIVKKAATH